MKACKVLTAALLLMGMSAPLYAEPAPQPPYGNRSIGGDRGGGKSNIPNKLPFFYLGVHAGVANPPSMISATSRFGLGASAGFRLASNVSLGAFLLYTSHSENTGYPVPYDKTVLTLFVWGGELNYVTRFWSVFAFRLGARVGPSKITLDSLGGLHSASTHPLAYGPVSSLDIFIRKEVSLGFEGTALFFGDNIHYAPFVTTYFNGSLKIWF